MCIRRSCICDLLKQCEVSRLSLTTKANYRLVRPILYRSPTIETFSSLTRFQRTITQATWMGKIDRKWSIRDCIDQTKVMDLLIDPSKESAKNMGQPPAAVMISRMLYVFQPVSAFTMTFSVYLTTVLSKSCSKTFTYSMAYSLQRLF